jgi:S-adenosylmethionine hydrolase
MSSSYGAVAGDEDGAMRAVVAVGDSDCRIVDLAMVIPQYQKAVSAYR